MLYKQTHRIHFDGDSFTYKLIILWFIVFKKGSIAFYQDSIDNLKERVEDIKQYLNTYK